MGLVPNPVADLKEPLERTQRAVENLSGELVGVQHIPAVHDQLVEMNRTMSAVLDTLQHLREDMARPR